MNENCYLTGKPEVYSKSGSSQILYLMLRLHVVGKIKHYYG